MTTEPTISRPDPFSSYGARVGRVGTFLTFKNGEFLYGQNGDELPLGTRLLANMEGLRVGWKRWFDGKVTDDLMELLTENKPPAPRNTLGELDKGVWETDSRGEPRDPWQLTNELTLLHHGSDDIYIFATASKGGIGAIGRLCKEYGKYRHQKPGMTPVIELANDWYMHREYGKTYTPVLTIVDWAADETSDKAIEPATTAPAVAPPAIHAQRPRLAEARPAATVPAHGRGHDLHDEIPF